MSYTLADILEKAIKYHIYQIHVSIPAKIVEYDPSKQKASIKPLVRKKLANDTTLELPVINDVPVIMPRSKKSGITFKIEVGETGLAVFSDRALEKWLTTGGIAEPGSARKYDISDAIFFPGLYSFNDAPGADNDSARLFNENGLIKIDNNGKIAIGNDRQGVELLEQLANLASTLGTETTKLDHWETYAQIGEAINKIKGAL